MTGLHAVLEVLTFAIVHQDEGEGKVEYKNSTKITPQRYLYTIYYWMGKRASEVRTIRGRI